MVFPRSRSQSTRSSVTSNHGLAREQSGERDLDVKKLAKLLAIICLFCGVLAASNKKSGPAAAVTSLPNPLAFPDTTVGTVSEVRTVTFYNIGQLPLYFTNFQVPPDFAIAQNTCVTYVPVGGTCAISLVFRPMSSGTIGEYLYVSGNMNYVYAQALLGNGL
jgi:hypothetical protein